LSIQNSSEKIKSFGTVLYLLKYFGVNKATFDKMLEILEDSDRYKRRKGGRPLVLNVLDKTYNFIYYRSVQQLNS